MVICEHETIRLGKKTGISYRTAWRWWKQGNLTGYQLPSGTIIITDDNPSKPDAELKDNGQ
jgi:predicted site-specific integrase-resolvase